MSDSLQALRAQIDALDVQIVALLNQRAHCAEQVGVIKKRDGLAIFRPEREAQVLGQVAAHNQGPLSTQALQDIYREVIAACRALEKKPCIAYLGPAGTFSEQAVFRQFGQASDAIPCASIDEVFRSVAVGATDFGVVPIENSTEGVVSRTLDLLLDTPLKICGEVALKIDHHLLSKTGTMSDVQRICAHPQALAQCLAWLNQHYPQLERVPVSSNGEAARLASQDPQLAAIAGALAVQRYGLQVVAPHIHDEPHNTTRFAVIGALEPQASGQDRTSLILSVTNQAGAVHAMLAPLAQHGVSMTRFESRPARQGMWTYYFYIDIEGHQNDDQVAAALSELKALAGFFKLLGSYPV